MKFLLPLFLLLNILPLTRLYSQDYIKTSEGKALNVKIVEVSLDAIKYKPQGDSAIHTITKSNVLAFQYGYYTTGNEKTNDDYIDRKFDSRSPMYLKGIRDAEIYYKDHRAAASGTYWTTFLTGPLVGLVPAGLTSATPPEKGNLGYPDSLLMKDNNYYNGYLLHAKQKKSGRVWRSYALGCIANLVVVLFFISTTN